jgi:hypothetical protein
MKKSHIALLIGVAIVFICSGTHPYDRLTWWLEVFPGIAGLIMLAATYRRFQFTTLVYTLIAITSRSCASADTGLTRANQCSTGCVIISTGTETITIASGILREDSCRR